MGKKGKGYLDIYKSAREMYHTGKGGIGERRKKEDDVSFYCHTCGRTITCRKRVSRLSCIRKHYWKHHRSVMMKERKRKK